MPEEFFEAPQPAAVLKHGILKRYLRVFAQKTGSVRGHRVAYIDGYAGPGVYKTGDPGSPALAVATARALVDQEVATVVDGYFVEREAKDAALLAEFIADSGLPWSSYRGEVEEHLPTIMASIPPNRPVFAFLDPFGLGIPMTMLQEQLLSRAGRFIGGHRTGVATEVLLNVSLPGIERNAGHLTSTATNPTYLKSRATILGRVDATMGGDWWRDQWLADPGCGEAIAREYIHRLTKLAPNWTVCPVPVADDMARRPDYFLVLLTQHADGVWLFHEQVSLAHEEYREFVMATKNERDLFDDLEVRQALWIEEIAHNLEQILSERPSFVVHTQMRRVYGNTLTFAREKHVRAAVKQLFKEGKTSTPGTGSVQKMVVKRP